MNNWRWDNPRASGYQVNHSNPQTTSSEKVQRTGAHFSWYGTNNLRATIEPPSCRQYKLGNLLAVRPLNWDEIIEDDDDDKKCADRAAPSGERSCPANDNDDNNGEGEEERQGGGKGFGKGNGTKDGKGEGKGKGKGEGKAMEKGKGKGKGHSKRKGMIEQTTGGDDISWAVALQLQKDLYRADSDREG